MSSTTTTSSPRKTVLIVGLAKGGPRALSVDEVKQMLSGAMQEMEAGGFDAEVVLVDAEPNPDKVAVFKSHLERKQWDCVSIGFGIRGDASLTDLFEDLVNAAVERKPGPPPKLSFCLGPDAIFRSVNRVMGPQA